jgi:excinuclease ABC subunit C
MKDAAILQEFETAAKIRNRLRNLYELKKRIMFGDKEFISISKDVALNDIIELFSIKKLPRRIEGYDVSHMGGTNVVASMVVFTNGVSDRTEYRKFKTTNQTNNDFLNMRDTIYRRFSANNLNSWGKPDLVLIDGGKGQLASAIKAIEENDIAKRIPIIGLAKKHEEIIISVEYSNVLINDEKLKLLGGYKIQSDGFISIELPNNTHIIKLLQRIRDESHRFAVSYHTVLKRKHQTDSVLDSIQGIGPKTKKTLLKKYGSIKSVKESSYQDLVNLIGPQKASTIESYLKK